MGGFYKPLRVGKQRNIYYFWTSERCRSLPKPSEEEPYAFLGFGGEASLRIPSIWWDSPNIETVPKWFRRR
jgi:hypothetical protein